MALDGMINSRRNGTMDRGQGRLFRGQGVGGSLRGGRFFGRPRGGPLNMNVRSSSYNVYKPSYRAKRISRGRDFVDKSLRAAGFSGVESGTKLYISNLDVKVSNDDIRELFAEFGQLERYAVHYGRTGLPNGSAEVVFSRKSDAVQALKRYNDVLLDGKPMKIEIIGTSSEVPLIPRANIVNNPNVRRAVTMPSSRGRGFAAVNRNFGPRGRGRGFAAFQRGFGQMSQGGLRNTRGGTRGRGRGSIRGVWRKKVVDKSVDELDKELDNYHAEAMQT